MAVLNQIGSEKLKVIREKELGQVLVITGVPRAAAQLYIAQF